MQMIIGIYISNPGKELILHVIKLSHGTVPLSIFMSHFWFYFKLR